MHKKKILIVSLYPHLIFYLESLINVFKQNNFEVDYCFRTKKFNIANQKFEIIKNNFYFSNGKVNKKIFFKLNRDENIYLTPKTKKNILYVFKYFFRLFKNSYYKKKRKDIHTLKQRNYHFIIRYLIYFVPLNSLIIFLINKIEKYLPIDTNIKNFVSDNSSYDYVLFSPINWENRHYFLNPELELLKAFNKISIKTIVYQLSLDNFYAREIIHFKPDYLVGWENSDCIEINKISHLKIKNMFNIGSSYLHKRYSQIKTSLINKNIDLLYIGSASGIINSDIEYEFFNNLKNSLSKSLKLIFLPHPANIPSALKDDKEMNFFDDKNYRLICSSKIVLGISTTLLVESKLLGTPTYINSILSNNYVSDYAMKKYFKDKNNIKNKSDLLKIMNSKELNPIFSPKIIDQFNYKSSLFVRSL